MQDITGRTFWWPGDIIKKEERRLHIWCDTLLCPTVLQASPGMSEEQTAHFHNLPEVARSRYYKAQALSHMRNVYHEATYVLILDRGLECADFAAMDVFEAAARILTSRWMQRLW